MIVWVWAGVSVGVRARARVEVGRLVPGVEVLASREEAPVVGAMRAHLGRVRFRLRAEA